MDKKINLTASIVVFNDDFNMLKKTVDCFLSLRNYQTKLYLIDNSKNNAFQEEFEHSKIEYLGSYKNLGFGAGHNQVLTKINNNSDFHLVLNPDVKFSQEVVDRLILRLEKDQDLSLIAPKVLFPDGRFQHSCRRYPKLNEMFFRRFPIFGNISKSLIDRGIYADKNMDIPFYAQYLTGCFHMYKTNDLLKIKGFDTRYFLYMEDVDICKKIDELGKKKMYFPDVHIYHVLNQGSSKNLKLFLLHTISMFKYFFKWGF